MGCASLHEVIRTESFEMGGGAHRSPLSGEDATILIFLENSILFLTSDVIGVFFELQAKHH